MSHSRRPVPGADATSGPRGGLSWPKGHSGLRRKRSSRRCGARRSCTSSLPPAGPVRSVGAPADAPDLLCSFLACGRVRLRCAASRQGAPLAPTAAEGVGPPGCPAGLPGHGRGRGRRAEARGPSRALRSSAQRTPEGWDSASGQRKTGHA